ncbi:hypothetical protein [Rubrivirga sp. IMCC45206]|uniref:hypothetical protein n=1 Tax=Rubrivirga sp. IMCC45206 TaxID=3391614 RepID=UPI00398FE7E6
MSRPDLARDLFGAPPLARQPDGSCALTAAGREAVARASVTAGHVVTLADVATASSLHPRTVLAAVGAGDLAPSDRTPGTTRLYFDTSAAVVFIAEHAGGRSR